MLRGLLIRSYPFSIRTSVSYSTTASEKVPVSLPGPVRVGSVIRERYKLLHRIGSGGSSTVWLVWDQQQSRYVSLKMKRKGRPVPPCRCPGEATFLRLVPNVDGQMHPGHTILPQLFDDFTLEADDTTGVIRGYECIVTNVLGQSVQTLCHENRISLPWDTMKQVVFSVLLGLDYLHSVKGILHGDLKPDNILLGLPDNFDKDIKKFLASLDPSQDTSGPITIARPNVDMLDIRLTDLDLAHLSQNNRHHSFQIQPQALRAPEVILGTTWGLPADIWNLGCLTYEMATSRYLYLQGPGPSDDLDQLSRMVKFLGDFPPGLIAASPMSLKYFEPDGRFKHSIERVPFEALVVFTLTQADDRPTGLNLSIEELALFIDFLRETMCLEVDKRGTALELLNHPWLDDMAKRYISKVEEEQGVVADEKI